MKPSVSVIVPCRNEVGNILAFIDSVLQQNAGGHEFEILIADGLSDDGTRSLLEQVARRESRVRIIDNQAGIVSAGLNQAIRSAQGEIIIRMDVHTVYAPDYILRCLETIEQTGADNVGGPWRAQADGWCSGAIAACFESKFVSGGGRSHDTEYEGTLDTVYLGCWRRSTLERLGGFDESLVRNQDDELNLRTIRSGGTVWQSPAIVSWYTPRSSMRLLFWQYFQYGFWKVAVVRKHRLPASWRHLVPAIFIAMILIALILVLAGTIAGSHLVFDMGREIGGLVLGSYAIASIAATVAIAFRRGFRFVPLLPAVFAIYHTAYGTGFLLGLMYWPLRKRRQQPLRDLYAGITR
jgi:glycosyltransferase involved in cell wall biosynthesis